MCSHKRQTIFCILPPHILLNLAKNGNQEEREFALQALSFDNTFRLTRISYTLTTGGPRGVTAHPLTLAAAPTPQRTIYDSQQGEDTTGKLVRAEGQGPVSDTAVNQAYDGLGNTFEFYLNAYHRNSIDNAGLPLKAFVHYASSTIMPSGTVMRWYSATVTISFSRVSQALSM